MDLDISVLVCRPSGGLGDVLCSLPALRAVRLARPNDHIIFATDKQYTPLLEGNPDADEVRCYTRSILRPSRPQEKQMPVVFTLQGPEVTHEVDTGFNPTLCRSEIFCKIAGYEPDSWIPFYLVTREEINWASGVLSSMPSPVVAVQHRAANLGRSYPLADELCEYLLSQRVGVIRLNESDRYSIREIGALLFSVDCVVSSDSGPLHFAVATKTPCVGLFGPTNPEVVMKKYLGDKATYIMGKPLTKCTQPCYCSATKGFGDKCASGGACLSSIKPTAVFEAIQRLIGG